MLENAYLRAVLAPHKGAGILALFVRRGAEWLSVMPDARDPACDLEWASFLMVPYSNRIEDGRFAFAGNHHALAHGADHAIHGDVRRRAWDVLEADSSHVCCRFRSSEATDMNWPWNFSVRAEYDVSDALFTSRLLLRNRSDEPFPAGFGWHPYFRRSLTQADEPLELRIRASAVYPDAHDTRIPSGPPTSLPPELDFREGRTLDPERFIDACLCGYDGNGWIAWPRTGLRLRFHCSPYLDHLVLFNPAGKPYVAMEPVTNANNGVNLFSQGDPTSGVVVLQPGESLEARWVLEVEWMDEAGSE
jgi:aldose 1-epimerase